MRGTINKAEDIRSLYNLRVVGELDSRKKNVLSGKGLGLTPEEQKELLLANLKVACTKESIDRLLISGTSIAEVPAEVKEYLVAELKKESIEVCITEAPDMKICQLNSESVWSSRQMSLELLYWINTGR